MATILLIEDTQPLAELYAYSLESAGHTVLNAQTGNIGRDYIHRQPVDLILLDIMLPGVNGLSLLREIKQDNSTKHIPVIMISVLEQDAVLKQAQDEGANGYLFKDHITPDMLVEQVNSYLKKDANNDPLPSPPV